MKTQSFVAAAVLALLASGIQAQPVVRDGTLADATGRTVYTFDKDELNRSNCAGGCLAAWPAFVAKAGATAHGDFGLIEANGAMQWTSKASRCITLPVTPNPASAMATAAAACGMWWAKRQHRKQPRASATPIESCRPAYLMNRPVELPSPCTLRF